MEYKKLTENPPETLIKFLDDVQITLKLFMELTIKTYGDPNIKEENQNDYNNYIENALVEFIDSKKELKEEELNSFYDLFLISLDGLPMTDFEKKLKNDSPLSFEYFDEDFIEKTKKEIEEETGILTPKEKQWAIDRIENSIKAFKVNREDIEKILTKHNILNNSNIDTPFTFKMLKEVYPKTADNKDDRDEIIAALNCFVMLFNPKTTPGEITEEWNSFFNPFKRDSSKPSAKQTNNNKISKTEGFVPLAPKK